MDIAINLRNEMETKVTAGTDGNPKCWDSDTFLLLVVAHWNEDLSWLTDQSEFPYVIAKKNSDDPVCGVPVNKGAEASSFLKFIINNHDNLPQNLCLLDGHEQSWHQPFDMLARLRTISHDTIRINQYVPLNGTQINTQLNTGWKFELFHQVWDAVVRPHLQIECPRRIVCDTSSQFIVSRELIQLRSIEFYEDLYQYTIGTKRWPGDENWKDAKGRSWKPGGSDNDEDAFYGGAFFVEWIWHIIFGQNAVYCDPATFYSA